jgi:hypothetical protein
MKTAPLLKRWREAFFRTPLPDVAIQITSRFLCGVRIHSPERKAGAHFILPLPAGVLRPSFDKPNLLRPEVLEELIREGTRRLGLESGKAALLLPESSARVVILPLPSLPRSLKERARIVRWRTAKLMPLLPEDVHLVYQRYPRSSSGKVVVLAARRSVVAEYEDLADRLRFRSDMVTLPSLTLVNLLKNNTEPDVLLIDVEEDALSLAAVIDRDISLFRQKPYGTEGQAGESSGPDRDAVLQDVENTLNFIEDREKRRIPAARLRLGLLDGGNGMAEALQNGLSIPVVPAEEWIPAVSGPADILAAVAGLTA